MGNVFKEGIQKVWLGGRFQEVRYYHETEQYDKVPFCKTCDIWSKYLAKDYFDGDIFVRESPIETYYNRKDRLYTWKNKDQTISGIL